MNPKYVANLELSKKLKDLGYPQKGEFWWVNSSWVTGYEGEIYWLCDKTWTLCTFLPKDGGEVPLGVLKPYDTNPRYDEEAYIKERKLIEEITYCHAPMAAEIKEKMPVTYPIITIEDTGGQTILYYQDRHNLWYVGLYTKNRIVVPIMNSDTEADACAAAMIHFLEKKMIKF